MGDDPNRFRAGTWDPKYPDFATEREGPLNDQTDETGQEPWTDAPATSHVKKFRYWDSRKYKFLRTLLGGVSQLNVVFRATPRQPEKSYTYDFKDPTHGEAVFTAMAAAQHPGEVIDEQLIKAGVPYTRDS